MAPVIIRRSEYKREQMQGVAAILCHAAFTIALC